MDLKVALNEDLTGELLLPWLRVNDFIIGEENGMIPIELPAGMTLIESTDDDLPHLIVSAEKYLEDNIDYGHDVIADIDCRTGVMSVRPKYWKGAN